MQVDFCAELLKKLKENGVQTAVDTCGYVSSQTLDKVIPFTDIFLYDIKAFDKDTHIKCTGHSNDRILENIQFEPEGSMEVDTRAVILTLIAKHATDHKTLRDKIRRIDGVVHLEEL